MTTIKTDFGSGGANLAPGGSAGVPDLVTTLREVVDDLIAIRTQFIAALAKLDADIAAGGATETNYEATCTPAALKSIKG